MLCGSHCYKLMYWGSSNSSTFSVYALCNRAEPVYEAEALSLKTWILLWSVTHLNVQLFWTVTSSSGMHGSIKWRKHFKVLCNYYLYCLFPGNSTARTIKSWDNFMIITICVFGPSEALKPLPFFFSRYICLGHLQSQAVIKVLLQSEIHKYLWSAQLQVGHLDHLPLPKAWGPSWKRGQKGWKSQSVIWARGDHCTHELPAAGVGSTRSPQDQVGGNLWAPPSHWGATVI